MATIAQSIFGTICDRPANGIMADVERFYAFGFEAGVPLSTAITSRARYFRSTEGSDTTISITGGTYQLRIAGVWGAWIEGVWTPGASTAEAGTRGDATAIRAIVTSADVYYPDSDSDVTATIPIGGVDEYFIATTVEKPLIIQDIFNGFVLPTSGSVSGGGGIISSHLGKLQSLSSGYTSLDGGKYMENLLSLDMSGWVVEAGSASVDAVEEGVKRFNFVAQYDELKNVTDVTYYDDSYVSFDAKTEDFEGDARYTGLGLDIGRFHLTDVWQRFHFMSPVTIPGANGRPSFRYYDSSLDPVAAKSPSVLSFLIKNMMVRHTKESSLVVDEIGFVGNTSAQKKFLGDTEFYYTNGISVWGDSLMASYDEIHVCVAANLQQQLNRPVVNMAVGGKTSTQITDRFLSYPGQYSDIHIICSGRNDYYAPLNTVAANVASMVAAMGHQNYIILGGRNTQDEGIGTDRYNQLIAHDEYMASVYGERFLNIHSLLMENYDPLNETDVANIAAGICPISLTSDGETGGPHPNSKANRIITDAIYALLISLGYDYQLLSRKIFSTEQIITDSGLKYHYISDSPLDCRGALIEPSSANIIKGWKGNFYSTTEYIYKYGNASATLTSVAEEISLLQNATDRYGDPVDLIDVVNQLLVMDIDNTNGGSGDALIKLGTSIIDANPTSCSIFVYNVSGSEPIRIGTSGGLNQIGQSIVNSYVEISAENITMSDWLNISVPLGSHARFTLPKVEKMTFLTSGIADNTTHTTSLSRSATVISAPTSGVIYDQDIGLFLQVTPTASGQTGYLWSTYVDSDKEFSFLADATQIILRKRSGGTNVDLPVTVTHAINTPMQIVGICTNSGMAIKTRTYTDGSWGDWSVWSENSNTDLIEIGETYQIGSRNSLNQFAGYYKNVSPFTLRSRNTIDNYEEDTDTLIQLL